MKLFIALTFVSVILAVDAVVSSHKRREILMNSLTECKIKENAPDSDYERVQKILLPETREGNCMVACILEDFAIVS
jgi:cell division protein FtsL